MYGIGFPRLSSDPDEQWLLEEAIMARYYADRRDAAEDAAIQHHHDAAQAKARELVTRQARG